MLEWKNIMSGFGVTCSAWLLLPSMRRVAEDRGIVSDPASSY